MPPVTQLCSSRPRLTLGLQYSLADMRHWIRLSSTTKKANKKIIYIKHKLWGAYRAKLFILQQKFSLISNRTFLSWDISYRWITESGLKCFKVRCSVFYLESVISDCDNYFLEQHFAEPHSWHAEFTKEELAEKLSSTTKSADHLNGLLRETEATNAILMEQIKVRVEPGYPGMPCGSCFSNPWCILPHFTCSHFSVNIVSRFVILDSSWYELLLLFVKQTFLIHSFSEKDKYSNWADIEKSLLLIYWSKTWVYVLESNNSRHSLSSSLLPLHSSRLLLSFSPPYFPSGFPFLLVSLLLPLLFLETNSGLVLNLLYSQG